MASTKSRDEFSDGLPRSFRGPDDIARFARMCLGHCDANVPLLLVIALDDELQLTGVALNHERVSQTVLGVAEMLDLAAELDATALALVEWRIGEPRVPERAEAHEFLTLAMHCLENGIRLVDCVVMVDHHWWSLRELSGCG